MLGIKLGEEETLTIKIVGLIGTAIGIGLNLTPGVLFYELCKGKRKYTEIPEMMFVSSVLCTTLNLGYSIDIQAPTMLLSNIICTSLSVFYASLYLFYYSEKKINIFILYLFMALNITLEILYLSTQFFIDLGIDKEFKQGSNADRIIGGLNMFITVINAAAPGQKILEVIKTGNIKLIPIVTTLFQCACSTFWFFYGLFMDIYATYIPNALGILLTGIQIGVYYFFYCKYGGVDLSENNDDNLEKENDNNIENLISRESQVNDD